MLSLLRLNNVRVVHLEPGPRCACSFGVRHRAIIWPHLCIIAWPLTASKLAKSLEQRLWDTADALRGNQKPSEYKHIVLGLVFLKYISGANEREREVIQGT
ncbi:MAG: type I restriction-modification system subunit M N-terminal domain-containing protein [Ferrimicrobium sp.]